MPSGIFYKDKLAVIGNGVVVDPVALLKELDGLNERGVSTSNLRISNRAQVILPYHLAQDEYEERRRGDNKIGTTKKVSDQLMWIKHNVLVSVWLTY